MSKTYKTAEACRVLDVQPYVLRYWEAEFAALGGKKSSPQRSYTEDELNILRRIKLLLYDEGYTMGGAKKKLAAEVEEAAGEGSAPNGVSTADSKGKAAAAAPTTKSKSQKKPSPNSAAKRAKPATSKSKTSASEKKESLDTGDPVRIETVLLELRKLHAEAEQILSLVRAAK